MGLPWVRLATELPRNHKILALLDHKNGRETAFVYCCSLAFSGEQGLSGFIPRTALPFIHAKPADVTRLTDVRLWVIDQGGGGWNINDWNEFQPSTEEHQMRSDRARMAAAKRWANR